MSNNKPKPPPTAGGTSKNEQTARNKQTARDTRLAAALRENLHRRKQQTRERDKDE